MKKNVKSRKGTNNKTGINSNITVMGKEFVGYAMIGVTQSLPHNLVPFIGTVDFWKKVNISKVNADRAKHGAPLLEGKVLLKDGKGYKTLDVATGTIENYDGHCQVFMVPVGTIDNGKLLRHDGKEYDMEGKLFLHTIGRGPKAE